MKIDINDVFTFAGLATLAAGIGLQFSISWAAIVIGILLFGLGVWKA